MGFKKVSESKANGCVDVLKFLSEESGLNIVIAKVPGPLVNGYFVIATEAFDDDGLPHTLEHLIFLGSEDYPYKGVLDLVANRNLASGTNAWTDTDHTCYTMTTAGSEGFLNLMPVYIDHILYPTLTDEGYLTEVHHISGEGNDAGVVYCEMQGRESSGESRVHLEMLRAAYPGHCGYKSETGGILKNLRESTSNEKVRDYHKSFYRPENMTLIITGQVEAEEVLTALAGVEKKIVEKGPREPPYSRPWQSPVPPLLSSVDIVVPYASDEEDNGMVYIAWRGPRTVDQLYRLIAFSMLLRYLTDSSISPLQKEFVEVADPVASNVGYSLQENSESLLYVTFDNVPLARLSEIKPRLDAKLRDVASGVEAIDMARLQSVINRQKLETLLNVETQPHNSIAFMLIGDFLYGNTRDDLEQRLNPITDLNKMMTENEEFWVGILKEYVIDKPSVTVRGTPSIAEKTRQATEEEMRIADQLEALGEEGLAKKSEALAAANAVNMRPPPAELLTATPVPDPHSVVFHSVTTYSPDTPPEGGAIDLSAIPVYTHLDHVNTNFIYLMLLMDTSAVPEDLRMLLPLYLEALLESPIERDGELIPYETVVAQLEQDTIATETSLGLSASGRFCCSSFGQTARITLQVEPAKYEKGVQWLHELLYCTKFTVDRLSIIAAKMVNEVAECRRNGHKICNDIITDLTFTNGNNNHYVSNMVRQHQFLSKIGKQLMESGDTTALSDMNKLRSILTDPQKLMIRMAANLTTLPSLVKDLTAPWKKLLPSELKPSKNKLNVVPDSSLLKEKRSDKNSVVLGLGCVESAFFSLSVPGISGYSSPDLAPLLVFLKYLTQLEGPMWRQVRGLGLTYSYRITPRPNEGLIYFSLFKSTNVCAAIAESKSIVDGHLATDADFDAVLVDSAKSSMMYQIISREDTIANAIDQSLQAYFMGVDLSYNKDLVERISAVTLDDMKRVGQQYVSTLFDPKVASASLVCHSNKAEENAKSLAKMGFEVAIPKNLNEIFLCSSA